MCTTNNLQVGSRDLNSGPFVCMKKTLLTGSSPQPQEGVQCKQRCHLDTQTDISYLPTLVSLFLLVELSGGCGWNLSAEMHAGFRLTGFSLMFFEVKIALNGMRKIYFTYWFRWS